MVRRFYLFIFCFILSVSCLAQETMVIKRRLTDAVTERITVLKTDINIKQGLYQAVLGKNIALATGNYDHNKRTGVWHFFNPRGVLLQNFDYTHNRLTYEALDTSSIFRYSIYAPDGDSTAKKDPAAIKIIRPIRIGGRYYGYIPYLRLFRRPKELYDIDPDRFLVTVELLVSPLGRLAEYNVRLRFLTFEKVYHIDINQLSEEDKTFIPATLNGKPIMCQVSINCFMSRDGQIDFD